jgi:hypothetical protein
MSSPSPIAASAELPISAPLPLIVKGSMHDLFIQMKQELEGITAFPSSFTRTDYLLSLCFETGAQAGPDILKNIAEKKWDLCPWFMIPIEHLRESHYARFVYVFTNMVYNPEKEFKTSIDGDPSKGTSVPSSMVYMAQCFGWLHAHSLKLTQFAKQIASTWDTNADSALFAVARICRMERDKYNTYLVNNVNVYLAANMPKGASDTDKYLTEQVMYRAYASQCSALIKATTKQLKMEARKAGISIFGMRIVSLEFDDLYVNTRERAAHAMEQETDHANI